MLNIKQYKNLIFPPFTLSRKSITPCIKPYFPYFMKIEYNNLYTHFIFTTIHRLPFIKEENKQRIEKYITGVVQNNALQTLLIDSNN